MASAIAWAQTAGLLETKRQPSNAKQEVRATMVALTSFDVSSAVLRRNAPWRDPPQPMGKSVLNPLAGIDFQVDRDRFPSNVIEE